MKLFLEDDINDIIILVRDDVKYSTRYDRNGEIKKLKLNLGNGIYIDMKSTDDDGNEIKYSVLQHFSEICEKIQDDQENQQESSN